LVESHSVDEVDSDFHVVTRHHHFNAFGESDLTGAVHGAEVELRTILVAERSVTATLFLLQDIDGSLELLEGLDLTRMAEHHTALDLFLVDTTEEQTNVVTSLALVEELAEHFHTGNDGLLVLTESEELNGVTNVDDTSLDTTGSNGATASDGEHVLNRHQEWLVDVAWRLLDPVVAGVHQLQHLLLPSGNAFESAEG
jgi:hypothetical protein